MITLDYFSCYKQLTDSRLGTEILGRVLSLSCLTVYSIIIHHVDLCYNKNIKFKKISWKQTNNKSMRLGKIQIH